MMVGTPRFASTTRIALKLGGGFAELDKEKNMNKSLLLMLTAMVAACGASLETRVQENLRDRPTAYREGYLAGCDLGKAEAANSTSQETRDNKRIQSDKLYANGWYEGAEWCRNNYRPSPNDGRHDPTKAVRFDGNGW